MRRYRHNRFLKDGLIGYLQKIIILVVITIAIVFTLSLLLETGFATILRYFSYAIFVIGAFSVLGGMKSTYNNDYNYRRVATGLIHSTKEEKKLLDSSIGFCLFMVISAAILYFISSLF
ncbi:hypothetical protein [Proteiniborus sp.]|uniref:hypothetical protein n=1 Tax=Proteiniborus sp. TaxID=2079015 RepID=UPI0033252C4F